MDEVIALRKLAVSWRIIADYFGVSVYELRKCFEQYIEEEYEN